MKKISILGSTGSIGTQTLDVIREHGDMQVVALSCGRNLSLIEKQAREFKPQFVSVSDENDAKKLRTSLADTDIEIGYGMEQMDDPVRHERFVAVEKMGEQRRQP